MSAPSSGSIQNQAEAQTHDYRTPGLNSVIDAWGYYQYFCNNILQYGFINQFNAISTYSKGLQG